MEFVREWPETAKEVLTQPSNFYETENRRDGLGYPLKFALVSFLLAGLISAIGVILSGGIGIGTVLSSVIGGLIGLFIGSGLVHIFVALLGGESGISETLAVFGYATALSPISAAISLPSMISATLGIVTVPLALLLGLYGLYIQVKGIETFHEMSTGKALLAVILPGLIMLGIALGLMAITAALVGISSPQMLTGI